jgi:hypothetical protein
MLQQAGRDGASYYERFIHEFPSVHHLARADEELLLWAVSILLRAKTEAKRIVVDEYGGSIPSDYDALIEPGIGQHGRRHFERCSTSLTRSSMAMSAAFHSRLIDESSVVDAASRIKGRTGRLVNQAAFGRESLLVQGARCRSPGAAILRRLPPACGTGFLRYGPAWCMHLFAIVHKKVIAIK